MISAIEKIRSDVFESCITSPETVVLTEMSVGSTPVGAKQARADRRERVEALAERELAQRRLELRPAAGDVVERRDGADVRPGVVARHAVGATTDHDRDLALVVRARLLAGDHDLVVTGP